MLKRYSLRSSPSGCARDGLLSTSDEPPVRSLGSHPSREGGGLSAPEVRGVRSRMSDDLPDDPVSSDQEVEGSVMRALLNDIDQGAFTQRLWHKPAQPSSPPPPVQRLGMGRVRIEQGRFQAKDWVFAGDAAVQQLPVIEDGIRQLVKQQTDLAIEDALFQPNLLELRRALIGKTSTVRQGSALQQVSQAVKTLLTLEHPQVSVSLRAQALLKHCRWCGLEPFNQSRPVVLTEDAERFSQRFRESMAALAAEVQAPAFNRKIKEAQSAAANRQDSIRTWMQAIFSQVTEVLWVHLQLGDPEAADIDVSRMLADRQAFLAPRARASWCQEGGHYLSQLHVHPARGLTQDVILLYDASQVREAEPLMQALANAWREATQQRGIVWSESTPLIARSVTRDDQWSLENPEDEQRREQVIRYLSDAGLYLHAQLPPRTRTLRTSHAPSPSRDRQALKRASPL